PPPLANTPARALYRRHSAPTVRQPYSCAAVGGNASALAVAEGFRGMIWHSEGGGPWGTGPRGGGGGGHGGGGGGPWGSGRGGGGGGGPRGPQPPNFEEMLRRRQDRFRRILPGGFGTGTGVAVVLIAIVVLWAASGFYRVLPDEEGIVLRFGAYNRRADPGLNYHWPTLIESVLTPSVTRVNRTEIGYRSGEGR